MLPLRVRAGARLAMVLLCAWAAPGHAGPAEDLAVFHAADVDLAQRGYVDRTGTVVIPPRYLRAYPFAANGLARVEVQDVGVGFIDARGAWVIAPGRFGRLGDFGADGLAPASVKVGEDASLGGAVTTPKYRAGFIDARGEWVLEPVFREVFPFAANGLARAVDDRTGLTGFIGTDGAWRIAPTFPRAGDFGADGLAAAARPGSPDESVAPAPMGYIDETGQWAIAPRDGHAYPFAHGVAQFTERGSNRSGYIDRTGAWVLAPEFGEGSRAFGPDGRAVVVLDDYRRPMLVDVHGARIALEGPVYSDFSAQGLAVAFNADGTKMGLIDGAGQWVLPAAFGSIGDGSAAPEFAPNGWLAVMHEGRPRLVDRSGAFSAAFDAWIVERRAQRLAERAAETPRPRSLPPGDGDGVGGRGAWLALGVIVVAAGGILVWRRGSRAE